MDTTDLMLLAGGGLAAGIVNTLAGGGSLLTVGILVSLGLPGTVANGTNRVGVLMQNVTSAWRFRAEGLSGLRHSIPVLVPVLVGSLVGAYAISRVTPEFFERLFAVVMIVMLVPILRASRTPADDATQPTQWSAATRTAVFFAIGLYGGAIQAGVGIFLLFALSRAGFDLVQGNAIKVVVIAALTAIAVPVFIASDQIDWPAAVALAIGFALGGAIGVRVAIVGGERIIRPVLLFAVAALAARMFGVL